MTDEHEGGREPRPEAEPEPPEIEDERSGREAEVLGARRESLRRLEEAGVPPFALSLETALGVREPDPIAAIQARSGDLAPGDIVDDVRTVAGRVVLRRDMGKLKFFVVRDRTGDLQLFCNAKDMDANLFALLDEVDLGDIVAATGRVGVTKRGELSVFVDRWAMLTKSLRPLPEKWHGLKDPDLQQRRRYLHLIADEQPRRYFLARAAVLKTMRRVLDERGYVEFEGPMLQTVAGGANARPFTTHHNALDMPMKLRISLELYLKRMLVGGVERVFELGRNFRNEGIDVDHNPEFTMLEAYQVYGDDRTMM
jgi:lysyl-tRNA synthetase class 2